MNNDLQKEIERLNARIKHLEELFYKDNFSNLYIERKDYQHIGNKLGFFSAEPVTKRTSSGATVGMGGGGGTTVTEGNLFGTSGTKYSIHGIVDGLKQLGLFN